MGRASPGRQLYSKSRFRLSHDRPSDKRDDIFVQRCGLAKVPFAIRRPCHLGPVPVTGGVVLFKLSKLLNQEHALGGPCLCFISSLCTRPGGAQAYRGQTSLAAHGFAVCGHRVIILTSADASPVAGGLCTGKRRRCEAKQSRSGRRLRHVISCSHSSTVLNRVESGRRFILVTKASADEALPYL